MLIHVICMTLYIYAWRGNGGGGEREYVCVSVCNETGSNLMFNRQLMILLLKMVI
jgi:hypothetical protein